MSPSRVGVALIAAGAALGGCHRGRQQVLKDSEGRTFSARCTEQGQCDLTQRSGPSAPGKPALLLHNSSFVVGVCDARKGAPRAPASDCRPLVCTKDANCPPAHGLKIGTCVDGLCTAPAEPVRVDDAVMLCLAGTGLGLGTPLQVQRYALAQNCGSPCKVPAPCRQP
jgi:hypothetical protein